MTIPEITPRAFFSLRTNVKQNAHYITDFQILYPAGSILILHNYVEKRQKHIKLFEKSCFLEMIVISPSRKLAAIIQNGEKGQILIFDMHTLRRRRTLNLPTESTTNRFETATFSHDDKFIMAITGEPDWNMVAYKWESGKVASILKATYPNSTGSVIQVCCSPTDNSNVCLVGPNLFRLLNMTESVWRQYGFQKVDQLNITSACWLSGERIVCGTSDGKIFFVDNGDLKGTYNALNVTSFNLKDETSTVSSASLSFIKAPNDTQDMDDIAVRALICFTKGFAFSCKRRYVYLFEKESAHKFKKRNVFKIPETDLTDTEEAEQNVVHHLSINVSQDKLLATTNRAQIYNVGLWGPDINVAPEIPFKHLGEPLHQGPILGLTMCIWKPVFATYGLDRTLRIWNYETETVLIVKHYKDFITCIDLHPTGNFIAVGFHNKVEISVVLMNDIECYRSLAMQDCTQCKFGCHGSSLATVNQSAIEIFCIVTMTNLFSLKGHTGRINALIWVMDDRRIVSCGSEGEIFQWDAFNGNLLTEFQTPGVSYTDIAVSSDGKSIYAVGSDGLLREITDSNVSKCLKLTQNDLGKIVLARSNLMMFLTGDTAAVLSVKMPLTSPPEHQAFYYHMAFITDMKLSFDDQTLVSVSHGGTVIIWKLNYVEGKTVVMDKNFSHSTEVLINKEELEKKILKIKNLSQELYEMEMEQAREMRDTEARFCDNIKDIHESFSVAIEDLKEKIEQTEADQNNQLATIKCEIDQLKNQQEKEEADMIENYRRKLVVEYEKVQSLDADKEAMVNDYESKVTELEQSKEEETNEIIKLYKEKLEDIDNLLIKCSEENAKNLEEHETIKQHLEDDADREIVETKAKYEGILKEEKELNMVLKEDAINMRKKHAEAQKEVDEFRAKVEILRAKQQKYQSDIQALEKDIADLKGEIMERDLTIEDKDERVFLLKKRIQELDKFKFVLEFKVKELRKQIDPKDREIRERKEEIADMEEELDNLKKMNSSLELQLTELREKIGGTEREITAYEKKHHCGTSTLRQIKVDIYFLYQELNNFKQLREGIKVLYHKYHEAEIADPENFTERNLQGDLIIQREFLEKTILALKSTLSKQKQNQADENKVVRDNALLLEELNRIRKELKEAVSTVKAIEKLIDAKGSRRVVPSAAWDKLQQALKKRENIKQFYQTIVDEAKAETLRLDDQVKTMQDKLLTLKDVVTDPK